MDRHRSGRGAVLRGARTALQQEETMSTAPHPTADDQRHDYEGLIEKLRLMLDYLESGERATIERQVKRFKISSHEDHFHPSMWRKIQAAVAAVTADPADVEQRKRLAELLRIAIIDLPQVLPPSRIPALPEGYHWNILLLDDDDRFKERLRQQLTGLVGGPDVVKFPDLDFGYEDVLASCEAPDSPLRQADMVFLDLYNTIPTGEDGGYVGFTGGRILSLLCREFPAVPVVVCTSHPRPETAWEMVRSGAAGVLVKPDESKDTDRRAFAVRLGEVVTTCLSRRAKVPVHKPPACRLDASEEAGTEAQLHERLLEAGLNASAPLLELERLVATALPEVEHAELLQVIKTRPLVALVRPRGQPQPLIIKAARDESLLAEYHNYRRHVLGQLDTVSGRIDRPPGLLFTRGTQNSPAAWSVIAYSFASRPGGGSPLKLEDLFQAHPDRAVVALRRLVEDILPVWYSEPRAEVVDPWQMLGFHLGSLYRLEPATVVPPQIKDHAARWKEEGKAAFWGTVVELTEAPRPRIGITDVRLVTKGVLPQGELDNKQRLGFQVSAMIDRDDISLWLQPGKVVHVAGELKPYKLDRHRPVLQLMDTHLRATGRFPVCTIHGDLNLGNVVVQPDFPDYPWLIDFAQTRRGCPLFDLVKLETELVFKVMRHQAHRFSTPERWARAMIEGRVAGHELSWFEQAVSHVRALVRRIYQEMDTGPGQSRDGQLPYAMVRAVYAQGAQKWFANEAVEPDPLARKLARVYIDACIDHADRLVALHEEGKA